MTHESDQLGAQIQGGAAQAAFSPDQITISVDAMGGDLGPAAVVAGVGVSAAQHSDVHFIIHGDSAVLSPLVAGINAKHPGLAARLRIAQADRVVTMHDKPSQVMRHGAGTSMWQAIDSVRDGRAQAVVSCGNTGALMAVSMVRLRKLAGVNRPAIACLWPSRNPSGFNVMLDVGAGVEAEPEDLLQFATMGAGYATEGLHLARPRVGLLNVGTEEHKGRATMKAAHDRMVAEADAGGFDFVGFVEGGDIPSNRVDVIVTDGFTGNIALKTAEGTAKLVSDFMREAFGAGLISKFSALLALRSLKRLQKRMDPRRVNGGVFLGLNGTVVKSHGAADSTGIAAALGLAINLARSGFVESLRLRLASTQSKGQDGRGEQAPGAGEIQPS